MSNARISELEFLRKLQRIGNEIDEFLYRQSEFSGRSIRLLPGVPAAFKSLHGLVVDVVRGAWVRRISRIAQNRPLLENADLESFLFGTARSALADFAPILRDHQSGRCLYCEREVRGAGAVDHFIAWSRYPVDLGHNLVLAHTDCNGRKRDFLAYPGHLERWARSHLERADDLTARFDAARLPHDVPRTRAVARWPMSRGNARRHMRGSRRTGWCGSIMKASTRYVKIVEWSEEGQCYVGSAPGLIRSAAAHAVSHRARIGTACRPSPKRALDSPS